MIRTSLRRRTPLRPKAGLRPRRKTRKGRIPVSVLDALWSLRIRERDKACIFPRAGGLGCAGKLEACHMYSKKAYPHLRWDLDNGNALCTRHHFFMHQNPIHAGRCYEARWGRLHLDALWMRAQANGKVDRIAVRDYLRNAGATP